MSCKLSVKFFAIAFLLEVAHCACPGGYTHRFGSKCYFFIHTKANLTRNVQLCKSFGGTLASIWSKQENNFLQSTLSIHSQYWIGLRKPTDENRQYTWMDGTRVNYTNWGSGQPDQLLESEWGATIYPWISGNWYDHISSEAFYQLCQYIDDDSKQVEPVRPRDELVERVKAQEKLTRDLSEFMKQAIARVNDVTSNISRNLTVALEKILTIDHRLTALEQNRTVKQN